MEYVKNPELIEKISFEMIDEIVANECGGYKNDDRLTTAITRRVIHTTADFDYLENLYISEAFISSIKQSIKDGLTIYTDTNMALSGINKNVLKSLGCSVKCYVADEEAAEIAKREGITRSMAAVMKASREEGNKLFVFGNAPTSIFKVLEIYKDNNESLVGVIGVPVGFVGAAESKDALIESGLPAIAARGRKGGSNVAAAIVNAILYEIIGKYE